MQSSLYTSSMASPDTKYDNEDAFLLQLCSIGLEVTVIMMLGIYITTALAYTITHEATDSTFYFFGLVVKSLFCSVMSLSWSYFLMRCEIKPGLRKILVIYSDFYKWLQIPLYLIYLWKRVTSTAGPICWADIVRIAFIAHANFHFAFIRGKCTTLQDYMRVLERRDKVFSPGLQQAEQDGRLAVFTWKCWQAVDDLHAYMQWICIDAALYVSPKSYDRYAAKRKKILEEAATKEAV